MLSSARKILERALIRPFSLFYHEHIIQLMGLYMGFTYGLFYRELYSCFLVWPPLKLTLVFLTTMSGIFEDVYQERPGIAGLHYIPLGIGLSIGSQTSARLLDFVYRYLMKKNDGARKPEYRLR